MFKERLALLCSGIARSPMQSMMVILVFVGGLNVLSLMLGELIAAHYFTHSPQRARIALIPTLVAIICLLTVMAMMMWGAQKRKAVIEQQRIRRFDVYGEKESQDG